MSKPSSSSSPSYARSSSPSSPVAAYRGTRGTLVAEPGVEPGAALKDLHERILAADPSLDIGSHAAPGPSPDSGPSPDGGPSFYPGSSSAGRFPDG
ncbi:hypothetical protein AB0F46_19170 [Streptomyces sp. NPDC026665]|uniref:hypothetical protein n=1 Tax=Streptomyces sp. NPDC026665 TaxID=3154798 RepID=UPI0033FCAA87